MRNMALALFLMVSLTAYGQPTDTPPTTPKAPTDSSSAATTAAKPPISLKEFEAISKKVPVQGTADERKAFGQEVARLGESLKDRTLSDRATFNSVSDAPRTPGQAKSYQVLCGPTKDPDLRLAVLCARPIARSRTSPPGLRSGSPAK